MMVMESYKILIADDEDDIRDLLEIYLKSKDSKSRPPPTGWKRSNFYRRPILT
jgi:DNA-binding response OmpR family regulator